MKTFSLKTVLLTLVTFCTLAIANAADTKPLAEFKIESGSKVVQVLLSSKDVDVTITDMVGHILVKDHITNRKNTIRPYNFGELKKGIYFIEISDRLRTTTQKITVSEKDVLIDTTSNLRYKPFFKETNNYVDVNMLIENRPTQVQILDKNSNILYDHTFNDVLLQKRFNLTELEEGSYTMRVVQDDHIYFHTFNQ